MKAKAVTDVQMRVFNAVAKNACAVVSSKYMTAVSVRDMLSKGRHTERYMARHMTAYVCVREFRMHSTVVAALINRDHSTVVHSIASIGMDIDMTSDTSEMINTIIDRSRYDLRNEVGIEEALRISAERKDRLITTEIRRQLVNRMLVVAPNAAIRTLGINVTREVMLAGGRTGNRSIIRQVICCILNMHLGTPLSACANILQITQNRVFRTASMGMTYVKRHPDVHAFYQAMCDVANVPQKQRFVISDVEARSNYIAPRTRRRVSKEEAGMLKRSRLGIRSRPEPQEHHREYRWSPRENAIRASMRSEQHISSSYFRTKVTDRGELMLLKGYSDEARKSREQWQDCVR